MSNFSKYFPDEVNDSNWEVRADSKSGLYYIVDGDGTGIAYNIEDWRIAYKMVNAQRFFNILDERQREVFTAIIKAEHAEEGKK